jgi:hypothetical protein
MSDEVLRASSRPQSRGRLRGKPPKLTAKLEKHRVALHAAGERTTPELAELLNVGRSTVYRALELNVVSAPPDDHSERYLASWDWLREYQALTSRTLGTSATSQVAGLPNVAKGNCTRERAFDVGTSKARRYLVGVG